MKPFLTANWKNLIMINYVVPDELLLPYLPIGVELDHYEGKSYVSFVAFHFLQTKVMGIGFPFHRNFDEINLRFYVKVKENGSYKRGVVFINELVPKRMITWIASIIYQEHYTYAPIKSVVTKKEQQQIQFNWGHQFEHSLQITTAVNTQPMQVGSKEEFIYEHYWGYTALPSNRTGEYRVAHPRWQLYPVITTDLKTNFEMMYGQSFQFLNQQTPDSVFVADGSAVEVFPRKII